MSLKDNEVLADVLSKLNSDLNRDIETHDYHARKMKELEIVIIGAKELIAHLTPLTEDGLK
jgi:hypothetical protein